MKRTHTEPSKTAHPETAVAPVYTQSQLSALFNQGWLHIINQRWKQAEKIFATIEAQNTSYEKDGTTARALRRKAKFEQIATDALSTGELATALSAFQQADDFIHANEVFQLLTIQELETKAEQALVAGHCQQAAWVYDHLLTDYPEHEKASVWHIKKEQCWDSAMLPFFVVGVQALEKQQWRAAYQAFAQILTIDPFFRTDGRSAASLSEMARKEVVLQADQLLRQGQVHQALNAYREVGHAARIENVDEFLRLRQREEQTAAELEAEGKWQEAATKYTYLATLYYDENGRTQWQEAVERCQENQKLTNLYEQGMNAFNKKRWQEAARAFEQLLKLQPEYQVGETPVRKLHRAARWRSVANQFLAQTNSPPQINTGRLS